MRSIEHTNITISFYYLSTSSNALNNEASRFVALYLLALGLYVVLGWPWLNGFFEVGVI